MTGSWRLETNYVDTKLSSELPCIWLQRVRKLSLDCVIVAFANASLLLIITDCCYLPILVIDHPNIFVANQSKAHVRQPTATATAGRERRTGEAHDRKLMWSATLEQDIQPGSLLWYLR